MPNSRLNIHKNEDSTNKNVNDNNDDNNVLNNIIIIIITLIIMMIIIIIKILIMTIINVTLITSHQHALKMNYFYDECTHWTCTHFLAIFFRCVTRVCQSRRQTRLVMRKALLCLDRPSPYRTLHMNIWVILLALHLVKKPRFRGVPVGEGAVTTPSG